MTATAKETTGTKARLYELAAEAARLICVNDTAHVERPDSVRRLDWLGNQIGFLLGLPEPEFSQAWPEPPRVAFDSGGGKCPSCGGRERYEIKAGLRRGTTTCLSCGRPIS